MRWGDRGEVREEREENWEGDKQRRERERERERERNKLIKNDNMLLQCGLKNESAL